jgi:hypothetical protein
MRGSLSAKSACGMNLMGIYGEGLGGQTPTITTWINGVKISEWTETEPQHPRQGTVRHFWASPSVWRR